MQTLSLHKMRQPLFMLSLLIILAIVATTAYFTNTASHNPAVFVTGDLSVVVSQENPVQVSGMLPGEEHAVEFSVLNSGVVPTHLKWRLLGAWEDPNLDPYYFQIKSLQRKVGDEWQNVGQGAISLDEEIFLSPDGGQNGLEELFPEESVTYRLTISLDSAAGNEFQNQTFATTLHVAAKQDVSEATWPEEY